MYQNYVGGCAVDDGLLVPRPRGSGTGDYSLRVCPSVYPSVEIYEGVLVNTIQFTVLHGFYKTWDIASMWVILEPYCIWAISAKAKLAIGTL